jgi:hypothetical protein
VAAAETGNAVTSPSRSPVADDFSDLLDDPTPGRNPPYRDDFEDLLQDGK